MANRLRLVMLGTGTFAEPTFRILLQQSQHRVVGVVTQPERGGGQKSGSTRQVGEGMAAIAQAAGIPVYQPESINTPEGVTQLRNWNADLLVTAAYGQILKADVLNAARLGGINVHGSLLPKYRGAAPIAWAIWRGETETGVTIIRMTTGLDAGEMLAKEKLTIGTHETAGEVESRLAPLGAQLAINVIDRLAAGPVTGEVQDPALVTKAPKLTKEHGAIDWTKSSIEVCRQIRAVQPWPTPYTFLHRDGKPPQRVLILRAEPRDESIGVPGSIRVDGKMLIVGAATGSIAVEEIQLAGKSRMSAAAWLNGRPAQSGDRFGPA
jgi:methionyl-tRNA formyltransferase